MVDVAYRPHAHTVHESRLKELSQRVHRGPTGPGATRNVCFSFAAYARNVINHLKSCHIPISKGLSDEEFLHLESTFSFTFPPDLKSILQEGLPVGVGFPNWRSGSEQEMREVLNLSVEGLCYQIARGSFWCKKWGQKPADSGEAVRMARQALKEAPTLVPIYSHCYIPSLPNVAGNPVFFVYGKDIFYCGYDLADFFKREAFVPLHFNPTSGSEAQQDRSSYTGTDAHRNSIKTLQSRRKKLAQNDFDMDYLSQRLLAERSNFKSGADCFSTIQEMEARKSVSEQPLQQLERPEALVKSAGSSPRMDQQIFSRYMYFHGKPLPNTMFSHFTIAAPPWAAKAARRIDFWSDLAEGQKVMKGMMRGESCTCALKAGEEEEDASCVEQVEGGRWCNNKKSKAWLSGLFEEMAKRLRRGGWKEEEIREMVEAVLPAAAHGEGEGGEAEAMNVSRISECLRKGGWSVGDVVEVCCLDEKQEEREGSLGTWLKLRSTKQPKAGSLADYFSKT